MSGDLLDALQQASGAGQPRRIYGLVFARVAEITDEGHRLEYTSLPLRNHSAPARRITPMGGGGRGMFFAPEVGDEVAVMFEGGDIDQPVILGALHSNEDPPPDQADTSSSNNVRTVVSRSGHEITLDDSPGATKVVIKSQGGLEITLQDVPPKIIIKTTGVTPGSKIELDGISWDHQHMTNTDGPTGPPLPISVSP